MKITAAGGAVLLTGAIPEEVERRLTALYGNGLAAAFLLAPYHGGRAKSFRHPREDVLQRTCDSGAAIYRADKDGQ